MPSATSVGIPAVDIGRRQAGRLRGVNVLHADDGFTEVTDAMKRALDPGFAQSWGHLSNPHGDGLDENGRSLFSLGRWGVPVNAVAVLYGILMVVNLAWPRAEVYDPAGQGWYLQYSAEIVLALVLVSGVFTFLVLRKNYFASIGHPPVAAKTDRPIATVIPAPELG